MADVEENFSLHDNFAALVTNKGCKIVILKVMKKKKGRKAPVQSEDAVANPDATQVVAS